MKIIFNINSVFIYGENGICRIVDRKNENFSGEEKEYYILKPIRDSKSTIYVPVDNEALTKKLKRLLEPEEARALINAPEDNDTVWIKDDRKRREKFKEIIEGGDRKELIRLLKLLYIHKEQLLQNGKKLHSADEAAMGRAEKILFEEFAFVLDITPEEVYFLIHNKIKSETEA